MVRPLQCPLRIMKLFDKANQHAAAWVKDMMFELGTRDSAKALHALRAGLQALRERLTVDEAAKLSAQLPLLVRGYFFEGWEPRAKPTRVRHREDFLALVRARYAPRHDLAAQELVASLFKVMSRHLSTGELTGVVMSLPEELVSMIDGDWGRDERPARVARPSERR